MVYVVDAVDCNNNCLHTMGHNNNRSHMDSMNTFAVGIVVVVMLIVVVVVVNFDCNEHLVNLFHFVVDSVVCCYFYYWMVFDQ